MLLTLSAFPLEIRRFFPIHLFHLCAVFTTLASVKAGTAAGRNCVRDAVVQALEVSMLLR